MGLHPKWRQLLPPREQASLFPGLLLVSDYGAKDDLVSESDHGIGAREDFDQP